MRTLWIFWVIVPLAISFNQSLQAQYKAPSQYFRKDFPAPKPGGPQPPSSPKNSTADKQTPAKPLQPKFKDLTTNATFYFLSDTNRSYAWTKISGTTAKNIKTGATQPINGETPIQR